jgi:GDP-mannose 6-dehydrogenase
MKYNISIYGAGYVGCVSAGCLWKLGHQITLVEIEPHKIDDINHGRVPIIEPKLDELIMQGVACNQIVATSDSRSAIYNSDVTFVCVGTPGNKQGDLNHNSIYAVAKEIGNALRYKKDYHVVAIRSTVMSGTVERCARIIERLSLKKLGIHFGICSNPEFLREGTAVNDYLNPPFTLIGATDNRTIETMKDIYQNISSEIHITDVKNAEFIKYVNNSWHAVKVAFANEVGMICKSLGLDSHQIMEFFLLDKKLNLSSSYLTPGFAFGGSCLPQDLKALNYCAHRNHLNTPLIRSVINSNQQHIMNALDLIYASGKRKIGILGLSFKPGTDDLRESPMLLMAEQLIGKGYQLMINDGLMCLSQLNGSNEKFLNQHIPHIAKLLCRNNQLDEIREFSDVLVIGRLDHAIREKLHPSKNPGKVIIDLVRIDASLTTKDNYCGICW